MGVSEDNETKPKNKQSESRRSRKEYTKPNEIKLLPAQS